MTLKKICRDFDIGRFKKKKSRLDSLANSVLKIQTSKGYYVVRLLKNNQIGIDRLVYAYTIMSILSEADIPVIKPLLNDKGSCISRYNGNLVQVTPFVEAASFQWLPEQVYYSGQMLRKFHHALTTVEESPKSIGVYKYVDLDVKTIIERLKLKGSTQSRQEISAINDFYKLLNQHSFNMSGLPKTIIHGDWHPTNQLYKQNGEVQCVLDFDSLQKGERIFDVAFALYFFLILHENERMSGEFLKGYGSLTFQEINNLPILIAKIGFFLGIFGGHEVFQLARNKSQLEWSLSEQGIGTIKALCVREEQ